jgi:hypothetical protein
MREYYEHDHLHHDWYLMMKWRAQHETAFSAQTTYETLQKALGQSRDARDVAFELQ